MRDNLLILRNIFLLRNLVSASALLLMMSPCHAQVSTLGYDSFDHLAHRLRLDEDIKDYSELQEIVLDEPSCAYLNITGIESMPSKKGVAQKVWVEVYLSGGNYFRKRAVIDAQGNSSLLFEKKNFKLDFCEDEWQGEETTDIVFGDWVKQDGFHFKAYYIDYLRGVGVAGYKLFDQMTATCGRPWTRAASHLSKIRKNARCYPGGFPCIVYLNGTFYGIYAWQLKKSRDNMNMAKETAEHIHLDGTITDGTLWQGEVQWKSFEVRNPKGLYDADGKNYDGDHPRELIDESSLAFDIAGDDESIREGKHRSAKVKHYIEALSQALPRLKAMESQGVCADSIRSLFEQRFDLQSLIDYACFHLAVNNWDGFQKNWQWFTYDGATWFVAPYDLDCLMGNFFTGAFVYGSETYMFVPANGPFYFINHYYQQELRNRYCELRDLGILSFSNIQSLLEDWYNRVGEQAYAEEWRRWPESKCISATVINEGWRQSPYVNVGGLTAYNDTIIYYPEDRCLSGHLVWEAQDTVCGIPPYSQLGYRDSLQRYEDWYKQRLDRLSSKYSYVSGREPMSITVFIPANGWTILCLPFIPLQTEGLTFYSMMDTGTEEADDPLLINPVRDLKAHTPYLVHGTAGYYCLKGKNGGEPASNVLKDNYLQGTYRYCRVPADCYALAERAGNAVLVRVDENDSIFVPAYHGFVHLRNPNAEAKELTFCIDAIQSVAINGKELCRSLIYDLSGRRISAPPAKGIYIKDGKKVIAIDN